MARSATTFRSKWKAGQTTVLRVPKRFASKVLNYARKLDHQAADVEINSPTAQYRTAEDVKLHEPVNVASVPQRSPFRYPGGKTWLVPYIRSWLNSKRHTSLLVEAFAGGSIVGLTAGFERLADHVILVESDPNVAAVWHTIFSGQAEWLADRILKFDLTRGNVLNVLKSGGLGQRERAFATIIRNRVQRGGIMAPGAGLVKTGENGRGLNSRWYPETLARRIREIAQVRHRFSFIEGDGLEIMQRYADVDDAVFFADPPYTIASRRLYERWQIDHRQLFRLLRSVRGDVLLTYDNTKEIVDLAEEFAFGMRAIAMKNTHHAKMNELLIGKDLSWLRSPKSSNGALVQRTQERLDFHP
jgi:DNA adenine methylase